MIDRYRKSNERGVGSGEGAYHVRPVASKSFLEDMDRILLV
jgi:hypothetical protein